MTRVKAIPCASHRSESLGKGMRALMNQPLRPQDQVFIASLTIGREATQMLPYRVMCSLFRGGPQGPGRTWLCSIRCCTDNRICC